MQKMRKYALVSGQGTACHETVLYGKEYTEENRASVEARIAHSTMSEIDRPIPGSWTDVTENDAV